MTLTTQCVSLPIAQKLKALGVPQESLFNWVQWNEKGEDDYKKTCKEYGWKYNPNKAEIMWGSPHKPKHLDVISAFTVAELGEMLPVYSSSEQHSNEWRAGIVKQGEKKLMGTATTEADARGLMLIYLLENGLLKL